METGRLGDLETWRHGDWETWRPGDRETWRRFVEGGAAVLHTVGAKSSVFHKTAYSCSVISRFVIQLQPNGLFFMQKSKGYINNPRNCRFSGRETSKMHLGTQKGVLGSLMEHREWKRKRQRASK